MLGVWVPSPGCQAIPLRLHYHQFTSKIKILKINQKLSLKIPMIGSNDLFPLERFWFFLGGHQISELNCECLRMFLHEPNLRFSYVRFYQRSKKKYIYIYISSHRMFSARGRKSKSARFFGQLIQAQPYDHGLWWGGCLERWHQ